MKVKCPKCRFKYDVEVPDGINEISCFCPRCGSPFIYKIKKVAINNDDTKEENGQPNIKSKKAEKEYQNAVRPAVINKRIKIGMHHVKPTSDEVKMKKITDNKYKYGGRVFLFVIIVLIIISFFRSCFSSGDPDKTVDESQQVERTDSMRNGDKEVSHKSEKNDNSISMQGENSVSAALLSSHNDSTKSAVYLKRPKWLEGYWLKTSNDQLIMLIVIKQKCISVVTKYDERHGVFRYEHGQVICNFDNDGTETYTIDIDKKAIVTDNGVWLDKVN